MKIVEGKLYFIKDKFIKKYNSKYQLMENKVAGNKRPTYFCFRDKFDKNILWFVPISSQYQKYMKVYNDIKSKKGIEPNNFVFARNLAGKKAVFLIQNMFPTIEKYIEQEYRKAGISIKVPKSVKEEIDRKTRDIFALTNKGIIATFTNLPEFIKDIKKEL